ncbi:hypothetical protein B0H12DRAFT_1069567 [Mycena haematopus]|nr:hypothetical protein B0H12DRAFT_1069567 [Mycena haematopus]
MPPRAPATGIELETALNILSANSSTLEAVQAVSVLMIGFFSSTLDVLILDLGFFPPLPPVVFLLRGLHLIFGEFTGEFKAGERSEVGVGLEAGVELKTDKSVCLERLRNFQTYYVVGVDETTWWDTWCWGGWRRDAGDFWETAADTGCDGEAICKLIETEEMTDGLQTVFKQFIRLPPGTLAGRLGTLRSTNYSSSDQRKWCPTSIQHLPGLPPATSQQSVYGKCGNCTKNEAQNAAHQGTFDTAQAYHSDYTVYSTQVPTDSTSPALSSDFDPSLCDSSRGSPVPRRPSRPAQSLMPDDPTSHNPYPPHPTHRDHPTNDEAIAAPRAPHPANNHLTDDITLEVTSTTLQNPIGLRSETNRTNAQRYLIACYVGGHNKKAATQVWKNS